MHLRLGKQIESVIQSSPIFRNQRMPSGKSLFLRLGRQDVGIDFGGPILEACKATSPIFRNPRMSLGKSLLLKLGRQDVGIDFGGSILEACKAT